MQEGLGGWGWGCGKAEEDREWDPLGWDGMGWDGGGLGWAVLRCGGGGLSPPPPAPPQSHGRAPQVQRIKQLSSGLRQALEGGVEGLRPPEVGGGLRALRVTPLRPTVSLCVPLSPIVSMVLPYTV